MKDPFIILECSSNSSPEEIDKQFKQLALKYHPDRNSTLDKEEQARREEVFKEINCAYQFLKKNDYKYTTHHNSEYSKFSDIFKASLFNNSDKLYGAFNNFRKFNFDTLADNMLKGITKIQDVYDNSDDNLDKADDICINAKVELFDMYHNVSKTIKVDLVKKCGECMALGYDINSKLVCEKCLGKKIVTSTNEVTFSCMYKNISFKGGGNEDIGKRAGNIYINLLVKDHPRFAIINDYNIRYMFFVSESDIVGDKIVHSLTYLDLKNYQLKIGGLSDTHCSQHGSQHYTVAIDEYGLYYPSAGGSRGQLVVEIFDPDNRLKDISGFGDDTDAFNDASIEFTESQNNQNHIKNLSL